MNDREERRAQRGRRAGKDYETRDLGNGVVQATEDEVMRAMGALPPDLGWDEVAYSLVPILPRRRSLPPTAGTPFRITVPAGIEVGFGIDIGPAFLMVGETLVKEWGLTGDQLLATAIANLRRRLREVHRQDLFRQPIDGVPTRVLQSGVGLASALILDPGELARLFGKGPALFLAPMRDILIALPPDVNRALAAWLHDEFAALDPNGLALEALVWERGAIRHEPFLTGGGG